jgi:phosphoglycolate phosphatase
MNRSDNLKPLYLLFDFDGTIADSFRLVMAILDDLRPHYNLPLLSDSELYAMRGLPIPVIFKNLGISIFKLPGIIHHAKKSMNLRLNELKPITGMPKVLQQFQSMKIPMALLTSNSSENVLPFLNKHEINIFEWFDFDVNLFNKSRHIRHQIHKRNLLEHNCIYIGDETRDIKAAQDNKIPVIAVTWGLQPGALLEKHHPYYLLDTPENLLRLITSF